MKDLNYYKKKLIDILEGKFTKSFIYYFLKARYDVGTIRHRKDGKYKKIRKDKWVKMYEGESKGKNIAVGKIKKQIENAKNLSELAEIIRKNRSRFLDDEGKPDKIVTEILNLIKGKRPEKIKKEIFNRKYNFDEIPQKEEIDLIEKIYNEDKSKYNTNKFIEDEIVKRLKIEDNLLNRGIISRAIYLSRPIIDAKPYIDKGYKKYDNDLKELVKLFESLKNNEKIQVIFSSVLGNTEKTLILKELPNGEKYLMEPKAKRKYIPIHQLVNTYIKKI